MYLFRKMYGEKYIKKFEAGLYGTLLYFRSTKPAWRRPLNNCGKCNQTIKTGTKEI
jgi:hypothetical protein